MNGFRYKYKDAPLNCTHCSEFKAKREGGEWTFSCVAAGCVLNKKQEAEKEEEKDEQSTGV